MKRFALETGEDILVAGDLIGRHKKTDDGQSLRVERWPGQEPVIVYELDAMDPPPRVRSHGGLATVWDPAGRVHVVDLVPLLFSPRLARNSDNGEVVARPRSRSTRLASLRSLSRSRTAEFRCARTRCAARGRSRLRKRGPSTDTDGASGKRPWKWTRLPALWLGSRVLRVWVC